VRISFLVFYGYLTHSWRAIPHIILLHIL